MLYSVLRDALNKQKNCTDDCGRLFQVIDTMLEFSRIARQYGLLALDEALSAMANEKIKSCGIPALEVLPYHLHGADRMIYLLGMMVVDAKDQAAMMDVAKARYFSANPEGREALAACLAIEGWRSIQDGEPPVLLRQMLLSMLPEEIADRYIDRILEQSAQD